MKKKVLFVGPVTFNPGTWNTRADYILPDLFSPLIDDFDLYLLTSEVPDFARKSLAFLCSQFDIRHIEVRKDSVAKGRDFWSTVVEEYALKIRPDVITNSLGSLRLGPAIAQGAKKVGARSVLRVAGDEIGSRVAMGKYVNSPENYARDVSRESKGVLGVDKVIVMSTLERARIARIPRMSVNKIALCIRGVDLATFYPNTPDSKRRVASRFLYVGRRSAEKGFDIIEAAAAKVFETNPSIEFIFVGDFEPQQIENRKYLGWVCSKDLPDLYRDVDAFVLTSRTEGFPQVVSEAMASGLPCILSRHLFAPVFKDGEDALLTDLSPDDVAQAIQRLASDPDLAVKLSRRSREIAAQLLDCRKWGKHYAALVEGKQSGDVPIFDSETESPMYCLDRVFLGHDTPEINSSRSKKNINVNVGSESDLKNNADGLPSSKHKSTDEKRLRMVFITPRVLGQIATPGTYLSVEAYFEHCDLHVIAKPRTSSTEFIVHKSSKELPVTLLDPNGKDYYNNISKICSKFSPDIICLGQWKKWNSIAVRLRKDFPHAAIILEVKSPVIWRGDENRYKRDCGTWQEDHLVLDGIIAPSLGMVNTMIADVQTPFLQHRSILNGNLIKGKTFSSGIAKCKKFVFAGSLAKERKLDKLINMVSQLPKHILDQMHIDFFGDGPARSELEALSSSLGLSSKISFLGVIPQSELLAKYCLYDAGIAWVPKDLYDNAPSLKLVEYCAAGIIPLATSSVGHLMMKNFDFSITYFDEENQQSFIDAMFALIVGGISSEEIGKNVSRARDFDYKSVVSNEILPFYKKIVGVKNILQRGENIGAFIRNGSFDAFQGWLFQVVSDSESDVDVDIKADFVTRERFLHTKRMTSAVSSMKANNK